MIVCFFRWKFGKENCLTECWFVCLNQDNVKLKWLCLFQMKVWEIKLFNQLCVFLFVSDACRTTHCRTSYARHSVVWCFTCTSIGTRRNRSNRSSTQDSGQKFLSSSASKSKDINMIKTIVMAFQNVAEYNFH